MKTKEIYECCSSVESKKTGTAVVDVVLLLLWLSYWWVASTGLERRGITRPGKIVLVVLQAASRSKAMQWVCLWKSLETRAW